MIDIIVEQRELDVDVDLEENTATATVTEEISIADLFVDGTLVLWEDGTGWSGFVLEDEVKKASATNDEQKASKLEKIEAVVRHAQSKGSGGIAGVEVEYGEVIAAADCSRQWAHTLMDEIGATYSWASTKAPAGKKKKLRIRTDDHSLEEMLEDVYGGQE